MKVPTLSFDSVRSAIHYTKSIHPIIWYAKNHHFWRKRYPPLIFTMERSLLYFNYLSEKLPVWSMLILLKKPPTCQNPRPVNLFCKNVPTHQFYSEKVPALSICLESPRHFFWKSMRPLPTLCRMPPPVNFVPSFLSDISNILSVANTLTVKYI